VESVKAQKAASARSGAASGGSSQSAGRPGDARVLKQHYEILKELAECHAALADYDRARDCYTQAGQLAPDEAAPHVGMGVVDIHTGRLDQAERSFRTALEVQPDYSEAYGGLAMIRQQQEDYPAAFDLYLKCLELDTDNLVALLGLFQTSCQMGTFSKVIFFLETYLDKHPGDTAVLFCLATLYAREDRLEDAREGLLNVTALDPANAEAAALLAEVRRNIQAKPVGSGASKGPPARDGEDLST
jgi:tetratricopeptide (TPR) repeat protein